MRTAIVYYSKHHGNTKRLVDAIAEQAEVTLIDVLNARDIDLSEFERIGFASGIYFSSFAKQVLECAEANLPCSKDVFFINTCGFQTGVYFDAIRKIAKANECCELGAYQCLGFDTFGPFKLIGGIAKGHPNKEEIEGAVQFYKNLRGE